MPHWFFSQISIHGTTMGSEKEFNDMVDFVAARKIDPAVDSVYPLAEAAAAHAHLESGAQMGKVVLSIR